MGTQTHKVELHSGSACVLFRAVESVTSLFIFPSRAIPRTFARLVTLARRQILWPLNRFEFTDHDADTAERSQVQVANVRRGHLVLVLVAAAMFGATSMGRSGTVSILGCLDSGMRRRSGRRGRVGQIEWPKIFYFKLAQPFGCVRTGRPIRRR